MPVVCSFLNGYFPAVPLSCVCFKVLSMSVVVVHFIMISCFVCWMFNSSQYSLLLSMRSYVMSLNCL